MTAADHIAETPFRELTLGVWQFGTMPEPQEVGCMVVVREEGERGLTITLLRGTVTGKWMLNHLAPRRQIHVVPEHDDDPAAGTYAPQTFDWWRTRFLVKRPTLGEALAVVIPSAGGFAA